MMLISFIKGSPALLLRKERLVVAGDLHIGNEFRLARSGIHYPGASKRMAEELLSICKKQRANGIVLLGDIKESIGYPQRDEFDVIASFFHLFRNMQITIVRGNHDAHIAELLRRIGINTYPVKELLLERIALLHGNAMPSEAAMKREYVIAGHSHIAIDVNGRTEKGWLVSRIGSGAAREYKHYNRRAKLVVMPAFSSLITGVRANTETQWKMPLLRRRVFDPSTAKVYDLDGNLQ